MSTFNVCGSSTASNPIASGSAVTADTVPSVGAFPWDGKQRVFVLSNEVDLTSISIVENDVYQSLYIPANTLVMKVCLDIETAAVGTTLTIDVGDDATGGGAVDGWDSNVDGKATGKSWSLVGTDAHSASAAMGKFYASADTIDLTMDVATAITAGPKYQIYALCVDFSQG